MARAREFCQKVVKTGPPEAQTLEVHVPHGPAKAPTRLIEKDTGPWVSDPKTGRWVGPGVGIPAALRRRFTAPGEL